ARDLQRPAERTRCAAATGAQHQRPARRRLRGPLMARAAMPASLLAAVLFAGALAPSFAGDQGVVYRCTDRDGHVTIQNDVACPAGRRRERRVVAAPPPLPAYVPREVRMPEVVAAEHAQLDRLVAEVVPDPVPEAERTPPPAL